MNAQIIAIANQKGGVGKTTTCANLGIGLAQAGKKVLLIDGDPQGSLTISLGNPQPDQLPVTLSDMMGKVLTDQPIRPGEGILHHPEGVDLMPADIQLSGMEVSLVNAMSRETILRQYLDTVKRDYSHILIDCQPSLGMLTVNALAAANRVLIPVQAEYLPAKGLEQLLQTIGKVRRQINPKLQIDGILLTMVDSRTNFARDISALLRDTYGSKIKVFGTEIPHSVRAKETTAESIRQYGVLVPAIARPDTNGGYELIAGHRRHHASEIAGMETMPVIVRDLDDDAATIIMVDSNLQRENILPSERAFAYKMKLEAMKHQGARSDLTCSQVGNKSAGKKSSELLAEQVGQSKKKIALNPADELSFLTPEEQAQLVETMDYEQATPSLSQAQRMKKFSQEGKLTEDVILAIMSEEKKSDLDKVTFTSDTLRKYFPKSYTPQRMQETIIKLLEQWQRKRQQQQNR